MKIGRRQSLALLAGLGSAALAGAPPASAMGRTPLGGRAVFHVPWPTGALDPHDLRDPMAALFGAAVADPLYALDGSGAPYPTLAAGLPTREAGETVVRLREGLRTGRLAALDGRDLVFSVERARARGAYATLADVPRPLLRKGDPLAAVFGTADPLHLARALASPLVALLPRRFTPTAPDGTGAFRADVSPSGLLLTRNLDAARGPAFLDAVEVAPAEDLKTSLRAFEAERDDLGWLGMGLHDGRPGAVRFDLGRAAWVVLLAGADAGPAAAPGAAQRLVDAIPPERLAHLGLGPLPAASGDPAWPGPPAELLVDDASPHLVEVARAVAPVVSNPGHEVTVAPVPRAEIARRRARGKATLAIELVRPLGAGPHQAMIALATADDPARGRDVARTPHHGPAISARSLTGLLRAGVLGDVRVAGGVIPDLVLARSLSGEGWDLGASYRRPLKKTP
jgi:peptide/nickel transport system substrate-binding protein